MKNKIFFLIFILHFASYVFGKTLHVGTTHTYKVLTQATSVAIPGDSVICHDPIIQGGMAISNLSGTFEKWIYILAENGKTVIIQGGSNSIQFSDCSYLHIEGFTIQGQTGNGMNIDDAGSFETPTHHIRIIKCIFQNISATGNNDLLKLSGLDHFEISECQFINGAAGGSGIDMVGCHQGVINDNTFKNLGSNSIQAKGGSSDIRIIRNQFENGGSRALNLGGSTGLAFFRPQNATTEAENIQVVANVFRGSEAAFAFVGYRKVEVSNNTILFPKKWVIRILQETVDPNRFLPCGDNSIYNNIIVIDNAVSTEVNIGPNTAPETFTFTKNLWYKTSDQGWQGPTLPGFINDQIIKDPLFINNSSGLLSNNSPAIGAGQPYISLTRDLLGNYFNNPPSLGAYEANPFVSHLSDVDLKINIFPNPFNDVITCLFEDEAHRTITIFTLDGNKMFSLETKELIAEIPCDHLFSGSYVLLISQGLKEYRRLIIRR